MIDRQVLHELRLNRGELAPFPEKRFREFLSRCRVMTKEFGLRPLNLLGSQRYMLEEVIKGLKEGASTFVVLKARQLGSSTVWLALDLFWAFSYPGMAGAFATHDDSSAQKFRATIDTFLVYLPPGYKIPIKRHNRNILILKNGSMFTYLVAGTKERQAGLGRSGAHVYIHATEVAFWGQGEDVDELKATSAQQNPHRLQIWESTANGFNHFEKMWRVALDSPTQRAIFVGWWRNDLYRFERDHTVFNLYVKNDSLSAEERFRVRAVKAEYGVDIEMEQIAWYRWCLENEQSGDQSAMDEKYPWTPDDAFQATGSQYFQGKHLTAAMKVARFLKMVPYRYILKEDWTQTALQVLNDHRGAELKIWEEMQPDGVYVLGCDPAYGSSDENDSTAMCVFRCFADQCYQVAEYASKRVTTYECAWILAHLAGYYRNVRVNLEITGPGNAVLHELQNIKRQLLSNKATLEGGAQLGSVLNHMTAFLYRRPDSLGGDFLLHTKTTSEIKEYMCNAFRDSFQLGRCKLKSMFLLDEMKTIVRENNWIGGAGKKPDDRFMAATLAHQTWAVWERNKLHSRGLTLAKYLEGKSKPPSEQKVQQMVLNYLRTAKIEVKT